jgi:hypothetical protein
METIIRQNIQDCSDQWIICLSDIEMKFIFEKLEQKQHNKRQSIKETIKKLFINMKSICSIKLRIEAFHADQ